MIKDYDHETVIDFCAVSPDLYDSVSWDWYIYFIEADCQPSAQTCSRS